MLNALSLDNHISEAGMMNGRSLPVGPIIPIDAARRRPYNQNQHINQQYPQQSIYPPSFVHNYSASYYPILPQYHNAQAQYPPFVRHSAIPAYVTPLIPQQQLTYQRPHHPPATTSSYRPPPPSSPNPPSTRSSNIIITSYSKNNTGTDVKLPNQLTEPKPSIKQFRVPLPWYSNPESDWPTRRSRKKRKSTEETSIEAVKFPTIVKGNDDEEFSKKLSEESSSEITGTQLESSSNIQNSEGQNVAKINQTVSRPISENENGPSLNIKFTTKPSNRQTPVTPALPRFPSHETSKSLLEGDHGKPCIPKDEEVERNQSETSKSLLEGDHGKPCIPKDEEVERNQSKTQDENSGIDTTAVKAVSPAPVEQAWTTPKSWARVFKAANATQIKPIDNTDRVSDDLSTGIKTIRPLVEALRCFNVNSSEHKVTFLEPRGLVNPGNMCYMNSILQALVFCSPFFNFLNLMSRGAVSSFKNETPLLDAMILVMREFPVIATATSTKQLRMRLKESDIRQFGEPFTPDFFYNVINQLPRFSSMRRGHQQDAEEFLGFLLEGLHDECVQVMLNTPTSTKSNVPEAEKINCSVNELNSAKQASSKGDHGWMEVGPKQKSAITRSSGVITTESPITKIFGGNLRSELRVPGLKDSITLEPYQPLQLDIGLPDTHSIVDALKGLTRSESLHGDFKSPKGPNSVATKQVFIETLPPVLILHLKRFQYDNTGGTQKIWKKIEYPLELELPAEIFPRQRRLEFAKIGLPKYQLIAVVYHHGKNASGGHYTVDVRRQDGSEWARIDDTVIRRVGNDDVAELGNEEDQILLASASDINKKEASAYGRGSPALDSSDKDFEENRWKQANGSSKKWSGVINESSTSKAKMEKSFTKDNKVAYILFYQRV